MVRIWK